MRILLDTHAWLWFVLGDASLTPTARKIIEDPANEKLISPASYWELAIKIAIGKYVLPTPNEAFVERAIAGQGFLVLPVLTALTALLCTLPFHHRDPFDRLLVAQALRESIPLLSGHSTLESYGIARLW